MDALAKFDDLVDRLVFKIGKSQTPVPGFIMGLSGTDSIVAYLLMYEAASRMDLRHRLVGIHYVDARRYASPRHGPTWFHEHVIPWLNERCPYAEATVKVPLGGNQDQQRWADLHLRALHEINGSFEEPVVGASHPEGRNFWTVGCTNWTETQLGKYSILSNSVSVQPIQTLTKTAVLAICEAKGVPAIAIENSRLPDCLCGRDEIAAANIELIDEILLSAVDLDRHPKGLVMDMMAWIRQTKGEQGHRARLPYRL